MATCGALALLDATSGHFTVLNAICGNAQGQWLHEALQTTRRYFRLLRLNKASMLRQFAGHAHLGQDIYIAYVQFRQLCMVALYQACSPMVTIEGPKDAFGADVNAAHLFVIRLLKFLLGLGKVPSLEAAQSKLTPQLVSKHYVAVTVAMRRLVNGGNPAPQEYNQVSRIWKWESAAIQDNEQWTAISRHSQGPFWDIMGTTEAEEKGGDGARSSETGKHPKTYKFGTESEKIWRHFFKSLPLTGKQYGHKGATASLSKDAREGLSCHSVYEGCPSRRNNTLQNFRKRIFEVAEPIKPSPFDVEDEGKTQMASNKMNDSGAQTTHTTTASLKETINVKLNRKGDFIFETCYLDVNITERNYEEEESIVLRTDTQEQFQSLMVSVDENRAQQKGSSDHVSISVPKNLPTLLKVAGKRSDPQGVKPLVRLKTMALQESQKTHIKMLLFIHSIILDKVKRMSIKASVPCLDKRTLHSPSGEYDVIWKSDVQRLEWVLQSKALDDIKNRIRGQGKFVTSCTLEASDELPRESTKILLDSFAVVEFEFGQYDNSQGMKAASRVLWKLENKSSNDVLSRVSQHDGVVKIKATE